jgi:transposase
MPPRLPKSVVADIESALSEPGPLPAGYLQQIAQINSTTVQTVYNIKRRLDRGFEALPYSGGPVHILQDEHETALKLLLDKRPWMYLDELQTFLFEAYSLQPSISTISRTLQRIKITRKRLKYVAAQRSEELRAEWLDFMQQFTANQVVAVDESGSDEKNGDRAFGWSHKGAKAKVSQWLEYRERVSVLAAYTVDGYIASYTLEGTCTAEIVESFLIDHLLPQCNPYPQTRSVVILDNASIHHKNIAEIMRAYTRKGVLLRFLPPYSPDFNPIEESFGDLKHWIRRHYRRERRNYVTYQDFLEYAVRAVGTGPEAAKRARAHFRNCGMI